MREAGLNLLSVSIDTIDPNTFRLLRGGANIGKITRNIERFRQELPEVEVQFMIVVTNQNIDDIEQLVRYGLDVGASLFVLREMFHFRNSKIVDHSEMKRIALLNGQFGQMKFQMLEKYGDRARFHFYEKKTLLNMSLGGGIRGRLKRVFA